ncbi:MAG: hypothetical protein ACPL4I_10810 [Bacteroidota bacterium]
MPRNVYKLYFLENGMSGEAGCVDEPVEYYCMTYDEDNGVVLLLYVWHYRREQIHACSMAYKLYEFVASSQLKLDEATAAKVRGVVLDLCGDALLAVLASKRYGCELVSADEVREWQQKDWVKTIIRVDVGLATVEVLRRDENGNWKREIM